MDGCAVENVLRRHRQVSTDVSYYDNGESICRRSFYADADTYQYAESEGYAMLLRNGRFITTDPEQHTSMYEYFFEDDAAYEAYLAFCLTLMAPALDAAEELAYVSERDGRFTALTVLRADDAARAFLADIGSAAGVEPGGGSVRFFYTFDAQSGDLLDIECRVSDVGGEERTLIRQVFTYDGGALEPARSPLAPYFEPGETRTVTVTYAADTDAAHTVVYTQPKGVSADLILGGATVPHIYSDPECTREAARYSLDADLVWYVKAEP